MSVVGRARPWLRLGVSLPALVVTGLFMTVISLAHPARTKPAEGSKFSYSQQRWERGRYLVEGPMHCFACHSESTWDKDGLPVPGRKGAGQKYFPEAGLPFKLVVPNISPDPETGSGTWTDEQFERALRQGIGHDGRVLFPLMPYYNFRNLSDEDLASVIVYIRSIPPVRNPLPKRQLPPELETTLKPLDPVTGPVAGPNRASLVERGKNLVALGNCAGCHTPTDERFNPLANMDFSGGAPLDGPWGRVASANITPDPSGISYYDEKKFIEVIRTGHVGARKLNQIMLWRYFRNMSDEDLKAIFAYLRTLKPVKHRVDNTEPESYCKVCRAKHGGGDLN